jgi:hypothetical protein
MRAAKHWKIIGLLLLVFFAGSVTGGVGTYLFTKRALEAAFDFDRWPDRGVRILDERMRLTPEQKVRVRVVQERLAGRDEGTLSPVHGGERPDSVERRWGD